jgi:hypothetical protein
MRLIYGWFLCGLMVAALVTPIRSAAQSGSYAVAPQDCIIEPIPMPLPGEEGNLATPAPSPTPIAVTDGIPADDAVVAAVSERMALAIACQNAGDPLRMLANFTDRWIDELFSGYNLVFYGRFQDAARSPEPLPEAQQTDLVSVDDVRIREDGTVLAAVTTRMAGEETISLVVLVEESGAWLIDGGELIDI